MTKEEYSTIIEIITGIGYRQRVGTYYVISENDGYINISHDEGFYIDSPVNFHKNFYKGGTLDEKFYTFEDFFNFINMYHKILFRRLKIEKIKSKYEKKTINRRG